MEEDAALELIQLLTLPPARDRHEAWLTRMGYMKEGHLSWRALLKPFLDKEVVEVSPRPGPWCGVPRCILCHRGLVNFQCGHAVAGMFYEGRPDADPRPSALSAVPPAGPGRPLKEPRQHARTSQRMLDAGDLGARRAAEERATKRARATLNRDRSASPLPAGASNRGAIDAPRSVAAAAVPSTVSLAAAAPTAAPRLQGYKVATSLEGGERRMAVASSRPGQFPIGRAVEIFSRTMGQWKLGVVSDILSTPRPGLTVLPLGSVQVQFNSGGSNFNKWISRPISVSICA